VASDVGISDAIERYYNKKKELEFAQVMNEIQDEVEVVAGRRG